MGGRFLLLDEGELAAEHVVDDGGDVVESEGFEAGFAGGVKVAKAAEDVGDEGELLEVVVEEVLAGGLAAFPEAEGIGAAEAGGIGVAFVVTHPGGVEGGPAGVGEQVEGFEQEGVGGEAAGLGGEFGGGEALLVTGSADEGGGAGGGFAQVGGGRAAVGAEHDPIAEGGAEEFAGAGVEIRGFDGRGAGEEGLVGGPGADGAGNFVGGELGHRVLQAQI